MLRLLAFMAVFLAFLVLADFFLVETDSVVAATVREMQHSDDIELAVVGSSVVRDHFNERMIREKTGLRSFSVTGPGASFQSLAAFTEELYKTNRPSLIALILEPYNFNTAREDPQAQYKLMPWLTGVKTRLSYYLANARTDGSWLDRALMFREFPAETLASVQKTIGMRFDPKNTFDSVQKDLTDVRYEGFGFLRHLTEPDLSDTIRREMIAEADDGYDYPLLSESKRMLLSYRDLVESHGSRLIVFISDNHTAHALAEPEYLRYMQHIMEFCRDQHIECYNLFYAKEEYLPNLDSFFYDLYHMTGEGADIQTAFFCRLLNAIRSGEDVSGWFYEKDWQYRESVTWITNCWVHPVGGGFAAGCNTGSMVTPQYRFLLQSAEGSIVLSDWSGTDKVKLSLPEDAVLRVEARLSEHPEQAPVYFEYPTDYDYAASHSELYAPVH